MLQTLYRHAAWDTPWWVNPNRSPGRYHAPGGPPVQYWCTHPLGPAAELLRGQGLHQHEDLTEVRLRLWAARVEIQDLEQVGFDDAAGHGIEPAALVADDHDATQALAQRLREQGAPGLIAPSAALPGTEIVVLFGPKVLFPYLLEPIDVEQVPTGHAADSFPPAEVAPAVRHRGEPHAGLEVWQRTGTTEPFLDPPLPRP